MMHLREKSAERKRINLAKKYAGQDRYDRRPGEIRVTDKIMPDRVQPMG